MYATLAAGYPGGPLPGLPATFREARLRRASGLPADDDFEAIADAFVAEIVGEQAAAGLTVVADGHVRWGGGLTELADGLLDGTITPADVARAWSAIPTASTFVAKQILPGPYSAAHVRGRSTAERRALGQRLVEVLAATAAALHESGCELIQLDEPMATAIGADAAAWRELGRWLADLAGRMPPLHRSLSLPDGAVDRVGHDILAALPFESYLVDVLAGPDSWRLISRIPGDRGIVCGAVDVHTERARDDPEMLVWAATLAAETNERGAGLVALAPNGDLAPLDRFTAKRKIERLGLAMGLVRFGPLTKVARALQPDPAQCGIASLRRIVAAHADAGLELRMEP